MNYGHALYKENTVFLTGGMSHGDDPTDSYATFYKFNRLLPADYIDEVLL
jgi:hypothetical protein